MKLKLKSKIFLPLTIVCVVLLGAIYFFFSLKLGKLTNYFIWQVGQAKSREISSYFDLATQEAMKLSSLFVALPQVKEAYKMALSGNIDVEDDPTVEEARKQLRNALMTFLEGYHQVLGQKLRIHFHLPNGRSFVRLWREKNAKRRGVWVDISDDISSFRKTVLTVARTGNKVLGIEIGRGGFSLRGVLPIKEGDRLLGSVEVLVDFNSILKAASKSKEEYLAVYMDSSYLPIATKLQDKTKFPILGDKFVQVYAPNEKLNMLFDIQLLEKGLDGLVVKEKNNFGVVAFPIRDFSNKVVGVLAYAFDDSRQVALVNNLKHILLGGVSLILVIFLLIGVGVVRRFVLVPIDILRDFAVKVAKGDLKASLRFKSDDELGELATALQEMVVNLKNKIKEAQEKSLLAEEATKKAKKALAEAEEAHKKAAEATLAGKLEAAKRVEEVSKVLEKHSTNLLEKINKTSSGASFQRQRIQETATAMGEMNATVLEVARNASESAKISEETKEKANAGYDLVSRANEIMGEVKEKSDTMKNAMDKLGAQAQDIGKIITVIEDIADQTNLLALNAAIEAARAGDAGRGFAVVADEVRKLAEKTMQATKEVGEAIEEIQIGTKNNIQHVDQVVQIIAKTEELITHSGQALEEIVQYAERAADSVTAIATASEEQSAASEEINAQIEEINKIAEQTEQIMQEAEKSVTRLAEQVENLKHIIEELKS
ncbi:HAMP domain-containing protein [Desulfonauticus submarinus]|uniref:HAMP domain-containing protein n=1 Tax=Desulfonauticus submarinus TaxID=206665 RepID=A0A1H0GGD9_9BACT|nr:methyl-accepting chemotaxis protein [Desulfonauticus submarinus]SDO05913.1 HAMP domain-containing protein [Desulfonauticus submarinus]